MRFAPSRCATRLAALLLLAALSVAHARDFYRELGVRRLASVNEIKAAYRELAKKFHPDKNKEAGADVRFQRIAEAYETLSDPEKRRLYDMHGDDYANVHRQQEQRRQHHQQFDPFGRARRPQAPPIFSVTVSLSSENYRDLVEDSDERWLLQFYHDWQEACKEFAPRWEALAHKLPPMVQLARVRVDENFGLVQRYRNFLRCRQNAFFVQCDTPALVLVSPGRDGATAESYTGPMQAEQIYEWTKRSFSETRRAVAALDSRLADAALRRFLQPPWAAEAERRRTSRAQRMEAEGYGRQPAKAVIFTSRAAADSLFTRHLAARLRGKMAIATMHVDGGLAGTSAAANVARSAGVTELPAIAVWANTDEAPAATAGRKPAVHYMTQGDGEQRRELLERIEASAASSAPLLTAANYHPTCGPSAWDESMRFCVLLMVGRPEGTPWSAEQKRLLNLFREVHADNPRFSVRFAWVDAARQQPFADALLGRKKSATDEPRRVYSEVVALRAHDGAIHGLKGLRRLRHARLGPSETASLSRATLMEWLLVLQEEPRKWRDAPRDVPPLRAETAPGALAHITVWFFSWGWALLLGLGGVLAAAAFYGPQLKEEWAKQRRQQQRRQQREQQEAQRQQQQQQQQQAPPAADDGAPRPSRTSSTEGPPQPERRRSSTASSALPCEKLTAANIEATFEGSGYTLVFVMNAGVVPGSTVRELAAHYVDHAAASWAVRILDVAAENSADDKPPRLRAVLAQCRGALCAVVRKGQKIVVYAGAPVPARVDEWIDRLKHGELSWQEISQG